MPHQKTRDLSLVLFYTARRSTSEIAHWQRRQKLEAACHVEMRNLEDVRDSHRISFSIRLKDAWIWFYKCKDPSVPRSRRRSVVTI